MKARILIPLLSTIALGLGACGGGAVDKLESWKKSACACEDAECATKEGKAFLKLANTFKDEKPSKDEEKKLDKLADEGQECLKKHGVDVFDL